MTVISIPDMSCGHCKAAVTEALSPLAQQIEIDLEKREAKVAGAADEAQLLSALAAVGFPATVVAR